MKVLPTSLEGVLLLEPRVFEDGRGFFLETYHARRYEDAGISVPFVQDNLSHSRKGTLRGLHYQIPHGQAKLVQVLSGEVLDVVVDIRRGSPSFGHVATSLLSETNRRQIFIPEGFAHGFCVLSPSALFSYKCSAFYAPDCEAGILWSDPDLGISWPAGEVVLSPKDAAYPRLRDVPGGRLPVFSRGPVAR